MVFPGMSGLLSPMFSVCGGVGMVCAAGKRLRPCSIAPERRQVPAEGVFPRGKALYASGGRPFLSAGGGSVPGLFFRPARPAAFQSTEYEKRCFLRGGGSPA